MATLVGIQPVVRKGCASSFNLMKNKENQENSPVLSTREAGSGEWMGSVLERRCTVMVLTRDAGALSPWGCDRSGDGIANGGGWGYDGVTNLQRWLTGEAM